MTDISNNIIYPSFFKINYEDTKNTFYLESLTLSNLKLWKKSILIDTSNNITVQHKEFSKLIINLKACLTEKLLLVNNSFTNKPLLLGNIFLYYCQYLSQHVFNNPYTIEPFMQNKILKKSFFSFIDNLIDSLYNKEYLDKFIVSNFKNNSEKIVLCTSHLQFNIFIPSTTINFVSDNYTIPESNWNITILIGNTD
jgi:hypothetical protein|uniref:Uncharacterized protein n=1 Tax=viral metagenome TaxID=1070528 RepID=A0A6C0IUF5_9ZZZZ